MTPRDPSPRQADALTAIVASIQTRGYPPTVRELAATFGFASTNAVDGLLLGLERKGWISKVRARRSRGITVNLSRWQKVDWRPGVGSEP